MKLLKKVSYIALLAIVSLTIGYFVYCFTQINGSVDQEVFKQQFFRTKDEKGFVSFGSFKNTVICYDDVYYFINDLTYDNGIFTLQNRDNEEVYKIVVIDEDTIYSSDFNSYFYNIILFSNE